MRSIIVRGWDGKTLLEPQDLSQSRHYWTWLGKQDVKLSLYTGLQDKDGKDLFFNDYVCLESNGECYLVTKDDFGIPCFIDQDLMITFEEYFLLDASRKKNAFKIIGNIYQNPKLK